VWGAMTEYEREAMYVPSPGFPAAS